MLPASSGTPLRWRLACACASRFSLSAAKPTQYSCPACARGLRAAAASKSGFSTKRRGGGRPLPSFFIFCAATSAARQSATAAAAISTSAPCSAGCKAACICRADSTSTRATPCGVGRCTGPAISVTCAPARRAARAMAKPILPLERLVRPRTGSMASNVGPAVTTTRRPANVCGVSAAMTSSSSSGACSMRPSPVSPQACAPKPTASTRAPSAAACRTLRCVAGCDHISRFMAGASSSGARSRGRARHSSESKSSARPAARRARKSALAGATRMASASRPSWMCAMPLAGRSSHCEVNTGWPESACIVAAVMKCCAPSLMATCTRAPACVSRRHSSAAL